MRKTALFMLALFIAGWVSAQQRDWTKQIGNAISKVGWMKQSDYGYLICGIENAIHCINNTTGDEVWVNNDLPIGAKTDKSEFIEATPYMLIEYTSITGKGRAAIMNVLNGKIVYHSKDDGVKVAEVHKLLKAGGLLMETIKGKEQILSFVDVNEAAVKWSLPLGMEKGGIGLGALKRKLFSVSYLGGEPFVSKDGQIILSYKKEVISINKQTGSINWKTEMPKDITNYMASADGSLIFIGAEKRFDVLNATDGKSYLPKPIKLEGEFNDIMPYNNDYIVMHASGFNIWDVSKMAFRFEKEKELGNISQVTVCPNGFAALETTKDESVISLVDFTGKRLWNEKLSDPVLSMYATSKGVWYVTQRRSNVLSFEKGKDLWKRDVKLKGIPSVAVDPENNHVLIYANKVLYRFDINEVSMTVLNEDATLKDFDEDKMTAQLEVRKDGYLISSSQNMCFVGRDGAIKFNNYFREVGMSKLARMGMKALSTGAGMYSAGSSVGDFLSDPSKFKANNGTVDLSDEYNRSQLSFKSQASGDISSGLFDVASKRYAASKRTKDFMFILTKFEDGNGLAMVKKDDGTTVQRFLFKDKEPEYIVDEVDSKLYLVENDKTIVRFSF
jgi:outer membrane protein assembly factor BamB